MNMSIGVQQMLSHPLRPGVWAAEEYFHADAFFTELRKRHFSIEIETNTLKARENQTRTALRELSQRYRWRHIRE